MTNIYQLENLLAKISEKGANIFGAGFVGKMFFDGLKQHGLAGNVEYFLVSSIKNASMVENIPVKQINDNVIDKGKIICVAVHESLRDEIFCVLERNGFDNYIWIYPFLLQLRVGSPLVEKKQIPTRDVYFATRDSYGLFVRYLMIEFFYKKNEIGSDLYTKAIALYSSFETSKKRLAQFEELIKSFEVYGFKNERPLSVFENFEVIDGLHRFALAIYYENSNVLCNVYQKNKSILDLVTEQSRITEKILEKSFTAMEITFIKEARHKLDLKFGA